MLEINKIHLGDARNLVHQLGDKSVQCIVTSPPYFGLRDYGMSDQMGLEQTPEEYIEGMVSLFRDIRKKLKDDGTLWLNIGDSYATGTTPNGLKTKDLIGIPWMLAFALRADGWYLRQDIIWHKRNPMPESVTDRCTKAHEYIFLLSKSAQYYYDFEAIMQDVSLGTVLRLDQKNLLEQEGSDRVPGKTNGAMKATWKGRKSGNKERKPAADRGVPVDGNQPSISGNVAGSVPWEGLKANKKSVWTVTTMPFKEAHFATFPEKLIVDCIKAGSREGDIILDPFMGAGTTALVARKWYRNYVGFELNPDYIRIAEKRLYDTLGAFM